MTDCKACDGHGYFEEDHNCSDSCVGFLGKACGVMFERVACDECKRPKCECDLLMDNR